MKADVAIAVFGFLPVVRNGSKSDVDVPALELMVMASHYVLQMAQAARDACTREVQ